MCAKREKEEFEIRSLLDSNERLLLISGGHSMGKTTIARKIFTENTAFINCTECISPRIMFERALRSWGLSIDQVSLTDNVMDFVFGCQKLLDSELRFLVLDNVDESFQSFNKLTVASICRLAELTNKDIMVVLITHLTWECLSDKIVGVSPYTVYFPAYSSEEVVEILCLDCPDHEDAAFFRNFVELVYQSHRHATMDLNEMRYLIGQLYPKYIEPIEKGVATKQETSILFKNINLVVKKSISSLFLRDISAFEWHENKEMKRTNIDLPRLTKFLVIASFLASYNPAKLDSRYFTRGGDTKVSKNSKSKKVRQQIIGPKQFPLERMLAIFFSILPDSVSPSCNINMQVATCFNLKLILKTSPNSQLDNVRCKSNISFSLAKEISKSVNFEIGHYLYDFQDI